MRVMDPIVKAGTPFSSASLWSLGTTDPDAARGGRGATTARRRAGVRASASSSSGRPRRSGITIHSMLDSRPIGASGTRTPPSGLALRRVRRGQPAEATARPHRPNSAFADLDYAIYLGPRAAPGQLLASSSGHGIPADVRQESARCRSVTSQLLLVVTRVRSSGVSSSSGCRGSCWARARGDRDRRRAHRVPDPATRARRGARRPARDRRRREPPTSTTSNERSRRRSNAASCPRSCRRSPAWRSRHATKPGWRAPRSGGDWFDLLPLVAAAAAVLGGRRVRARIEAAATMASLRYSMRGVRARAHGAGEILHKLRMLMNVARNELFATVDLRTDRRRVPAPSPSRGRATSTCWSSALAGAASSTRRWDRRSAWCVAGNTTR